MRTRLCTWSRYLYYLTRQSQSVSRLSKAGEIYKSRDPFKTVTVVSRGLSDSKDSHGQSAESDQFKQFTVNMDLDDAVFVNADDNQGYIRDQPYEGDLEKFEFDTKTVAQTPNDYECHMSKEPNTPKSSKVLRVALIGTVNSGKSTLINNLIGWKINSVSSKINTTRENTPSILTKDDTQIVLIDTPGVMSSTKRLRYSMSLEIEQEIEESVKDADMIGVIYDCEKQQTRFLPHILKILHENPDKPSFLILNKVDLFKNPTDTLPICGTLTNRTLAGRKFGKSDLERSRDRPWKGEFIDVEDFERKLMELEKKYGKLDCLIAKEGRSENTSSFEQIRGNITEPKIDLEETEETVPTIQLQEDSYQKDFLEDVLQLKVGENNSNYDTMKTAEKDPLKPTRLSWVEKLEKEQKESIKYMTKPYWSNFEAVFPVSALKGHGVGYISEFLFKNAKPGPWLYHSSVVTCQDPVQIAKMCVRQALLDHVEKHLPYIVDINILYWNVTNYNRLEIVMELLVKNRYEMGLILKNQPREQAAASRIMFERVNFHQRRTEDIKDFQTQSWRITQIACDAKQALLDAFQCEIKFKLGVRLDRTVKRKVDNGKMNKLLRRRYGVQKHGAVV